MADKYWIARVLDGLAICDLINQLVLVTET